MSDILFLQKRDHPIDIVPEWVNLDRTEEGHTMNSYFVAHPEMVLGDTVEESTAYGMDITVRPIEGMELSELLKEAVSHIQGTYPGCGSFPKLTRVRKSKPFLQPRM